MAADFVEWVTASHVVEQQDRLFDCTMVDWQYQIDLDEVAVFINESFSYGLKTSGSNRERHKHLTFHDSVEGILMAEAGHDTVKQFRDIFQNLASRGGEPLDSGLIRLCWGFVDRRYSQWAENLVELMSRLGYHTFRHVIRSRLNLPAIRNRRDRPKHWLTTTSDAIFLQLPRLLARQVALGGLNYAKFEES